MEEPFAAIWREIWQALEQAAGDADDDFHSPVLGTTGSTGSELRTVILREVDRERRALVCHSDVRAGKVAQIRQHRQTGWLFYSARRQLQIRASGPATVGHLDAATRQTWEQTRLSSRRAYTALRGPGTPSPVATSGLPPHLEGRVPTGEESEAGWPNFAVITGEIERLDWLHLDPAGYRRVQFSWSPERAEFEAGWLIP